MSTLQYSIVDAFATSPFKGNSAAVIVLDPLAPVLNDAVLQQIAAQFNLSETAFVTPVDASKGRFALRWFAPVTEVALCGHATLAAASVLFSTRAHLPEDVKILEFATLSGILTAQGLPDGKIELDFPAGETTAVDDTLQQKAGEVVRRAFPAEKKLQVCFVGAGHGVPFSKYLLIEVDDIDLEAATVHPDVFHDLGPKHLVILVTQKGRSLKETFVSRVFVPISGIGEDPVTGSAHCLMGPYWAKKLQLAVPEMLATQVSPRSGEMEVSWDREKETCKLRGHATLSAKGELYLPK